MTDHKFTDEEIVKALECCGSSDDRVTHCKGCPLYEYGSSMCIQTVMGAALSLINRQRAEIERLERGELREAMTFNSATINRCVASAVKEFAEQIKTEMRNLSAWQNGDVRLFFVGDSFIDQIVEKMTEGKM